MTELEFTQKLRADAALELARVKVLAAILPFVFLSWLDSRASKLESVIRQFDDHIAKLTGNAETRRG